MDDLTRVVLTFVVVGVVFTGVGIHYLRTPRRVGWLTVPGTVVGWSGGGMDDAAHAVVDYPLPDGSTHRFTNRTAIDLGSRRTGHTVTVLVDPEDLYRAELAETTGQARLLGGIFVAAGALVLGVGIAVAVIAW